MSVRAARANLDAAPTLTLTLTSPDAARVFWPSLWTDFTLQRNTDLTSTNWTTPTETVNDNGTIRFITVSPLTGNQFYRLLKTQ